MPTDVVIEKVVQEVKDEISKIGANSQKNYEELRKNYEELKRSNDSEKIEKLVTDISVRQSERDKSLNERIDTLEITMQKFPQVFTGKESEEEKEAKAFYLNRESIRSKSEGVSYQKLEMISEKTDVKEFLGYKKVFNKFLRNHGDERALSPDEFKLLQVGIDPDGGYTVTPFMSSRIMQRIYEGDPIRQLCTIQPITTEAYEELVDWGDGGAEWESETVATTDSTTPTWNKKRIGTHTLATRPKATQNMLEDSSINVESWLSDKIANRFARTEGAAFVNGSGVGRPRGFLTYPTGTNFGQIEQVNMGHATMLTADGFISMKYALKEYYLDRGTWLMNRLTLAAAMKLKDGMGDYIWKPGMLANDPYSTLLGLPVRMSTTMPIVAANALSVALADWTRAYIIVDRLGISILRDPYTSKPNVEFYTRKRVGGDAVDFDAIKIGKVAA
jgi:HK97 family phage major capsid protein